ncbi:MAG: terminase large subunit [Rhizobiaceae bacterium]|nr:terminase large subunit [Rhizobiaceae bacterium]
MSPWSTACPDWEDRILSGRSLVPDLPLFRSEADKALRIFKRLRIPDVFGQPTMEQACGPWFFPVVEALFGSYDPNANRRMVQEFFQLIPKKNGKSSNGGAIMVVALIMNKRPEAEFLLVAPTKEIADIAFKQAKGTIKADPALDASFHIQDHIRRITRIKGEATLTIKAADTEVITGSKATGTMIDETHVFAKKGRAADVFVELRGALAARPDGFLFQITTQSKEPPAGVFKAELDMARAVRDGRMELPLLPILYELPLRLAKEGGWKERRYWGVVNPNMGRSVSEDFLERELRKAEDQGAAALALFASQHFNVEIGLALKTDRWEGAEYWESQTDKALTLEKIIARCDVIVTGVDGGGLDDLLSFGVLGRERGSRNWLFWTKSWVHRSVLELRKSEAQKFLDLEVAGDLEIVDDLAIARVEIAGLVEEIEESGLLAEKLAVGVDAMGVGLIVDEIAARDIETDRIVGIPQGWKLNGAIKTAAVKLAEKGLIHAGQPIMAYAIGNAKIVPKGSAVTVEKETSGRAKIDPFIALLNCVALMSQNPESAGGRSIYDTLGAEGDGDEPAPDEIDMEVLKDHTHPLFQVMRERYNAKLAREDNDEAW